MSEIMKFEQQELTKEQMSLIRETSKSPDDQGEQEEGWHISNDSEAEWCLQKIKDAEDQKTSWKNHFADQLRGICETADQTIGAMMHYLREYFDTLPHKKTATEENYRLPSGKLVLKSQNPEFERDDEQLIEYLRAHGLEKYIKVKESVDWTELKKSLSVLGSAVADENGEIIPCITVIEKDPEFKIAK